MYLEHCSFAQGGWYCGLVLFGDFWCFAAGFLLVYTAGQFLLGYTAGQFLLGYTAGQLPLLYDYLLYTKY